ncbi:retrovirus-related Pol polyprotein from transposon TNT 1-94 [Trichonephila clavata]|uniref:Retrovirus-related Pol polyprotein from transposon TNT 1-94 n=1 Tax=Trichonephila clavata TaxID=2740835 RepID=A0A8X6KV19_TRICU|nr:retrovirus-related Pol polyprotein from transposon TNT 1-94 [Trichonephila clavata]
MANYSIPKLEGQNYVSWANDVKYLLMERQVWHIVYEKEIAPKLDASTDAEAVKEVKNFKALYQNGVKEKEHKDLLSVQESRSPEKQCPELTSRRNTMNNSYRSPRRHCTPRNVKGSYQHGKRCQSHLPDRDNLGTTTDVATRLLINVITSTTETGEVEIAEDGKVLLSAYLKNGVYHLYPKVLGPRKRITFEASALMDKKLEFWHKRLAHVSPSVISRTVKENGARGLPNFKNFELKCEPCQLNKQRRVSFKRQEGIRSRRPLELLYGDVWGPCNKIGRWARNIFYLSLMIFQEKQLYTH